MCNIILVSFGFEQTDKTGIRSTCKKEHGSLVTMANQLNSHEMADQLTPHIFSPLLKTESYIKCTEELQNFENSLINHITLDFNYVKVL